MALDEPKEDDILVEKDGVSFAVDNFLARYLLSVTIGYRSGWLGSGFFYQRGKNDRQT